MDLLAEIIDESSKALGGGIGSYLLVGAVVLISFLIFFAFSFFILWLMLKLNRKIFSRIEKKHGKQLRYQFMEKCVAAALIILLVVIPLGGDEIAKSLLGSTAVIAAIAGIAAQDVIKDVFSGLAISIYKPFDIGDRIELEDGTVGIVESITMRHVVIVLLDTIRMVIPNSKLNHISVLNYSYGDRPRTIQFKFSVSHDADIVKTKKVIYDTVKESPYSIEGINDKTGKREYMPVYFLDIRDSALMMSVTVFYSSENPTWIVKDDINTRVYEALRKNNIEVPYNYMNIIMKEAVEHYNELTETEPQ